MIINYFPSTAVYSTTIDDTWTDIIQSDQFILGNRNKSLYSLDMHMKDHKMTTAEMVDVLKQFVTAVHFLHDRGMCHGSIKEENIILNMENDVRVTFCAYNSVNLKPYLPINVKIP